VPATNPWPAAASVLAGVYGLCGLVAAVLYRLRVLIRL